MGFADPLIAIAVDQALDTPLESGSSSGGMRFLPAAVKNLICSTSCARVGLLLSVAICLGALLTFSGCEEAVKRRPYGFLRVGPLSDFLQSETYRPDLRMLFRRDDAGLSVMSTLCTHDLSPLVLIRHPDGSEVFASEYSKSRYRKDGEVTSGPAVADLPYYKLKIDEGVYGGPRDTLYVEVGSEVPSTWRLPLPSAN
ncbi:MAG: hypothetical protein EBZ48_11020 [Proteobacteria bacterium]|nr:hypothetical protein [Pseudomonadota bacterium]